MNEPSALSRALRRQPLLLAQATAAASFLRGLPRARSTLASLSIASLAVTIALTAAARGQTAWAVRLLLDRPTLLAMGCAVYAAALVIRRRREAAASLARSWLVATPGAVRGRRAAAATLVAISLAWRLAALLVLALLVATDAAVALQQSLHLAAWAAAGACLGAALGAGIRRAPHAERHPASRYTRKPRAQLGGTPSAAALSRWPAAQALAWSRPENSRWLLFAAMSSVPMGAGALGGLAILATWLGMSYLTALLAALPRVGAEAAAWLRSTPIDFWSFAWPIARGYLWQQAAGAAVAALVMIAAGAAPLDVLELVCLWLALVTLVAAVSLADCYRARVPHWKIWTSGLTALLAEQRARGLGVALALAVAAWHLRRSVIHERA